jgi:undecaprenyl-diphosphatase
MMSFSEDEQPVAVRPEQPVEEDLADRLAPLPGGRRIARVLRTVARADRRAYGAVARLHTPALDAPLRRISDAANYSRLWMGVAAGLALAGGRHGRKAAATGMAAIGLASFVVNIPMKRFHRRARPDREGLAVPLLRHVRMPTSSSFPSGHSASAFAFATAVGAVLPAVRVPLRLAAATVAYSRVHTGVHYPGDVVVGSLAGVASGLAAGIFARRLSAR